MSLQRNCQMKLGKISTALFVFSIQVALCFSTAFAMEVIETSNINGVLRFAPDGTILAGWGGVVGIDGLAVDGSGNTYVSTGNTVLKILNDWSDWSTFASGLDDPDGLAFDSGGNLYAINNTATGFNTIDKIDTNGDVSTLWSIGPGTSVYYPLAIDGAGNLYTANFIHNGANSILKIDPNGNESIFLNSSLSLGLNRPIGMACDGSGNIYVSYEEGGIEKFTTNGVGSAFAPGVQNPGAMTFDSSGDLFVTSGSSVDEVDTDGNVTVLFQTGFEDAFTGIAVLNVPEPSSLALAGIAALAFSAVLGRSRK